MWGGLCPSASGQAVWDGVTEQHLEEESQGETVTALPKPGSQTWTFSMQRTWLNTLVRVNLQVVEMKGEFGVSNREWEAAAVQIPVSW